MGGVNTRKNYLQYLVSLFLQKPFRKARKISSHLTTRAEAETIGDTHIGEAVSTHLFAAEKRKYPRSPVGKTVVFSILRGDGTEEETGIQAYAVDISDGGIGILTDRALEHGRTLRFNDNVAQGTGVVRWRIKFIQRNIFRIGIQFTAGSRYPSR